MLLQFSLKYPKSCLGSIGKAIESDERDRRVDKRHHNGAKRISVAIDRVGNLSELIKAGILGVPAITPPIVRLNILDA
jgi:hypothetical protein